MKMGVYLKNIILNFNIIIIYMVAQPPIKTEKELIMFYHTSLRNVGLYTTISLALLGYSRFYRGKIRVYNVTFILISLIILTCSILICLYMINDSNDIKKHLNEPVFIEKWLIIPKIILVMNSCVAVFGLYTFYREFTKTNKSKN